MTTLISCSVCNEEFHPELGGTPCFGDDCDKMVCNSCIHDAEGQEWCPDCCPLCEDVRDYSSEMEEVL